VERGGALEARDPAGHTPLFWATGILPGVRRGHKHVAELLVSRGADVEAVDNWGNTPFDTALYTPDLAETLLAHGAELTIWAAAALGRREQVEGMVQADPSLVNAEGGFLFTPLHWAALNGQKAVAALLLELGADVNARGAFGQTPLQQALGAGHTEVADLLRQHGATE
jgi:ankyrin repeat protein